MFRQILRFSAILFSLSTAMLAWATWQALRPFPDSLDFDAGAVRKVQILDRHSNPLTVTYQNDWNLHDFVPLHEIPALLRTAFIAAEDKRFYRHYGMDWRARFHAVAQNLIAGRIVRGASTISEQCVRMLHPRPRTFWSRWVETFAAMQLERKFSKADILEFYLNQVPYANQRRGVAQAARYYFDRDLATLSDSEMLALAVLVRSPSRLDLHRGQTEVRKPLSVLAQRLYVAGSLAPRAYQNLFDDALELRHSRLPVQAAHFVNYLYRQGDSGSIQARLHTTLDSVLQTQVQEILDARLSQLRLRQVHNGAVLVVDHERQEVLAWVNGGDSNSPGSHIDAVTTPRQPGSTLKPLIYALALEQGWTAATLIDDSPLTEAVGQGMHSYHNYSRTFYGPLRMRDALGNSLNIPAVRAIQFVDPASFLDALKRMGVYSLQQHADFYGDGLALGNGELSLLELVQMYTVLARNGVFTPLRLRLDSENRAGGRIFSAETATLIGDILSDPDARRLEFGSGALLRLPVQTAVKTGTSSDYRDAWAVGFNHRYTVGVWLGNFDRRAMQQISGAVGPALILRSVFAELNKHSETRPLLLSPKLRKVAVCRADGSRATPACAQREEWFVPGTEPDFAPLRATANSSHVWSLAQPAEGVQLALDPRIPDSHEVFMLRLAGQIPDQPVEWWLNDELLGVSDNGVWPWPVARGHHTVQAKIRRGDVIESTPAISFWVK
jgi:penicillin-binding protein 1C